MSLHQNISPTPPPNDHLLQRESSSCSRDEEYRSVIDDLTLEIQELKRELERCKQSGPDILHGNKLFEVKVHGLPLEKKTELEATLRDIAIDVSSSQKKKTIPPENCDNKYSKSGIQRNHAPSPPRLNLRRTDSAYHSTSTGVKSFSTPPSLPTLRSTNSSNDKAEDHPQGLPKSLYQQHLYMTDNERQSLVVGRLEQLFTGRINGTDIPKNHPTRGSLDMATVVEDVQMTDLSTAREPPTRGAEPIREVNPLPLERYSHPERDKSNSRDLGSTSGLDGDQMEVEGDEPCLPPDANPSSLDSPLPTQRPTRPGDLDPDRTQTPSENTNYLRHLGQLPPESSPGQQVIQDVHLDTEGWVYLNLLYSLAQLHIINVTPDFVRSAISEISTKLQLSPDGHKIRWRGGSKDPKFRSYNSQKDPFRNTIHDSENKHPHQKTSPSITNDAQYDGSSMDMAKHSSQLHAQVERFRYTPLFARQESSDSSPNETGYPSVIADGHDLSESGWGLNYSGDSAGRLQRREGVIIYYSGAPFCTDLSGDPDDITSTSQTHSSSLTRKASRKSSEAIRSLPRTTSGSLISYRPLTDGFHQPRQQTSAMDKDSNEGQDVTSTDSGEISEVELDLIWSDDQQYIEQQPLVPSGIGGVLPDDHFVVVVDTKRPKQDITEIGRPNSSAEDIIRPQAKTSTSWLAPLGSEIKPVPVPTIEIEFLSARIKNSAPLPLPPPAIFFPPSSTDSSTSGEDDDSSDEELLSCS
ncbi:hypothetical protein FSARC_2987 [Fusarium sarcochroum]|uniref:Frequency clock protein n=1 Tax=Fusarium sarcochroum TaxID=1208366 RepID=A0A8H4XD61_9HYPO|nr:hypothetical protein FSARC_2987 [Fusarium sarcochroum]